ncbi:MAG: DUF2027 domain-containing protein [Tannerella sp.]|jgi:hypothetical protein|nr:DUF2027 domain-containing protein [Tannerella sp.]
MRKEDFFDASSQPGKRVNIGDKVRFLNSVGSGTVTAFRGKDQVLVEDENGFDIPALIAECVVVGEADRSFGSAPGPVRPVAKAVPAAAVAAAPPKPAEYRFEETPRGERLNVYLAFLLVDPKNFMKSNFESYIINESNYYMYFNFMSCKNNGWTSRRHGLVEPDTKIFIGEFEKASLNELEHVCVQMMAFKEGRTFSMKNVVSVELRPDTVKFYKLHCFTGNDFFDEDALIFPLVTDDAPEKQMLVSASEIREAMFRDAPRPPRQAPRKAKTEDAATEIDLHINQLIDNAAGMSNADILGFQMSKFHETVKANVGKTGRKTVFIHGKGEGVLRSAIEKELKTTYGGKCRFQDASFREYGFGATMVIF